MSLYVNTAAEAIRALS
ncbi:hypothetical protein BVY32_RS26400, partial [Escherichia coli]